MNLTNSLEKSGILPECTQIFKIRLPEGHLTSFRTVKSFGGFLVRAVKFLHVSNKQIRC